MNLKLIKDYSDNDIIIHLRTTSKAETRQKQMGCCLRKPTLG